MPPLALPVPSALNLRQFASLEREANFCSVSQFWVPVFLCAKRHFAKKQKSQSQQSQSLELSTMFSHYSLGKVVMHVKTNLAEN